MAEEIGRGLNATEPLPALDLSGLVTLLAGTLIILITFFTSYSHVDIPGHGSLQIHQQIGIPLLLAALAAIIGEVKLASNNRCADQRNRDEARNRAAEERNRASADRERTARHTRIQAQLAAAQCRFLLADSARNRLQLSEMLSLLLEDLNLG